MLLRNRILREKRIIKLMIGLYCKSHNEKHDLCNDCRKLLDQVHGRFDKCRYGIGKPNCSRCSTYCYSADMRMSIRNVMKYSGPRMLLLHPVLTLLHFKDAFIKVRE